MDSVSVRYIVDDVPSAIDFYTRHLGFRVEMNPAPGFALLSKDRLQLLLNEPGVGGAGQSAGGVPPQPGGWNRFQIRVENLAEVVAALRREGVRFRGDIVQGRGGAQILAEDPAGNAIELFEPGDRS